VRAGVDRRDGLGAAVLVGDEIPDLLDRRGDRHLAASAEIAKAWASRTRGRTIARAGHTMWPVQPHNGVRR
jgi:hypothetical protein